MKARLLKKILNNTRYNVSNSEEYIAVGSSLCHDLYSVNKKTLQLKYALGKNGRADMLSKGDKDGSNEMLFIWDKLQELIDNGQIHDIINGQDELENPLPVFTVNYEGEFISTFTDEYKWWPNTTINGDFMYEGSHFKTKEEAIANGISNLEHDIKYGNEKIAEIEQKLQEVKNKISERQAAIGKLKSLLE